jgi:hypothetical protein
MRPCVDCQAKKGSFGRTWLSAVRRTQLIPRSLQDRANRSFAKTERLTSRLLPNRYPAANAAVISLEPARCVVTGKMSAPGRGKAAAGCGSARRSVRADGASGIFMNQTAICDLESDIQAARTGLTLTCNGLRPNTIERAGATGLVCSGNDKIFARIALARFSICRSARSDQKGDRQAPKSHRAAPLMSVSHTARRLAPDDLRHPNGAERGDDSAAGPSATGERPAEQTRDR